MFKINYNKVGNSSIYVSEITLGCMNLDSDSIKSEHIIDYALYHGINHLDTADLYDFGLNESLIGRSLKHKRQDILLTSKVGNEFDFQTKEITWNPSRDYIIKALKASLLRLNTDYLDFYLLHGGTIEDNTEETIDAFESLKKDGLIRSYGISSIRPNVINKFIELSKIDVVMMQYSILDRRPEYNLLDKLDKNNISVFARGSLAKGILTNTSLKRINLEPYLSYTKKELESLFNQLDNYFDIPIKQLALQYTLMHPAIASNVVGVSSLTQLVENLNLNITKLSEADYQKVKDLTKLNNYLKHI